MDQAESGLGRAAFEGHVATAEALLAVEKDHVNAGALWISEPHSSKDTTGSTDSQVDGEEKISDALSMATAGDKKDRPQVQLNPSQELSDWLEDQSKALHVYPRVVLHAALVAYLLLDDAAKGAVLDYAHHLTKRKPEIKWGVFRDLVKAKKAEFQVPRRDVAAIAGLLAKCREASGKADGQEVSQ